jgi:dipeptidyl-peptidase-4
MQWSLPQIGLPRLGEARGGHAVHCIVDSPNFEGQETFVSVPPKAVYGIARRACLRAAARPLASLIGAALAACGFLGWGQGAVGENPLTVKSIFTDPALTAAPPTGIVWAPDGTRVSYLSKSGDLMQVEGVSGKGSVLLPKEKVASLTTHQGAERDVDHRARYGQATYIWAPDSQSLLFDHSGQLWFFSLKNGTGLNLADTGEGSGDDPKFSPNGQYLSYIRNHNLTLRAMRDTTRAFHLTGERDGDIRNGEVDWVYEEELDVRSNYFWSPDSKNIAFLQMNEAGVPQYPLVDWIPVHAGVDMQRYPQPGDPNPAVRVGVASVPGGHITWLKIPLDAGNDYVPRFGWLNNRTVWVETLTRDHKQRRLYFADAGTGDFRQALLEEDKKFFDESYDITFIGDSQFLWTSWRDGHTQIYLYGLNPSGPLRGEAHLERQLTHGDGEASAVEGVDMAGRLVYYLSNENDPRQQQIWAVKLDGTGAHQVSEEAGYHAPVFSPNGRLWVDTASATMRRPSVSMCGATDGCKAFWTAPAIPDYGLIAPKELTLKAADGKTTLYASLLLPPGKEGAGSVPLINNPYGGPHSQTVADRWGAHGFLFDELLAEHGFAVLHVDNRGMGGRGREFAEAAYHDFGPVQLADQLAAVDQVLAAYPQIDAKRLGWWGWSWGGTFTLYALTHSDRFVAGVSVAPVTDWRDYDSIYTERYLSLPTENADEYKTDSVVTSAHDLKGRVLIAHGTGDDNVHLENTIQFLQKLIDSGIPYDLQLFPRKTHSIAGPEARTELYSRILWQFETYLMPEPKGKE